MYFTSYTKLFSTCRIGTWREDYLGKSIEPDFRRGNNDQVPSKAHSNSESSSYLVQCNPEQWDRIRMKSHGESVRATTQPSLAQMDSLEDYIRWNLDIVLASGWKKKPKGEFLAKRCQRLQHDPRERLDKESTVLSLTFLKKTACVKNQVWSHPEVVTWATLRGSHSIEDLLVSAAHTWLYAMSIQNRKLMSI